MKVTLVLCALLVFRKTLGCPSLWTQVGVHCYRLVSSVAIDTLGFPTVYHARLTCKQYGGDMATIASMQEENEIYAILRNLSMDSTPRKIYIGLTDVTSHGHFSWLSGEQMTYTNWAMGQPEYTDEHCVVVKSPYSTWRAPEETEWHDYPCCQSANIKHVMCSRAAGLYDEDIEKQSDIFESICNTVDECESNPCQNGGTCHDHVMYYTCSCHYGYRGSHCQKEILCPLPDFQNATIGSIHDDVMTNNTSTALESIMTVTCEAGLGFAQRTIPPSKQYNCTTDGWVELKPEPEIKCPPFPTWEGYVINITSRYYGDTVEYTCADDMYLEDGDTVKTALCNSSASWEPTLVPCLERKSLEGDAEFKKKVEAEGAVVFGVFGLALVVSELALFVLMDLSTIYRQVLIGLGNIKYLMYDRRKSRRGHFRAVPTHL